MCGEDVVVDVDCDCYGDDDCWVCVFVELFGY